MSGYGLSTSPHIQGGPGHRTIEHPAIADIIDRFDKDAVPLGRQAWVFDPATNLYVPGVPLDICESLTATSAATQLDLAKGLVKFITLGIAATTLSIINAPPTPYEFTVRLYIKQGAGGNQTVTFWPNIKWGGGGAVPVLTAVGGSVDRFAISSVNGGANSFGDIIDLDYQ